MTAESTKSKIITAAGELAAQYGLDNVSTRKIAERSGENIGSIHYHFGGKGGLFEAVAFEALETCVNKRQRQQIEELTPETATPERISKLVRTIVADEIHNLFGSDRPQWQVPFIYQLLQRDDELYDLIETEVINPGFDSMSKMFHFIDPDMGVEEVHLLFCLIKMPIISHGNYMNVMLKRLDASCYSKSYLKKLEDLLVKQTQHVLGLPDDRTL